MRLEDRIERERRLQTRSRRIRRACRWTILLCGISAIGLTYLGVQINSMPLQGLACALFVPTFIAAALLFVMGGLAPTSVRSKLSSRERKQLDD